jgi:hypothetical protein
MANEMEAQGDCMRLFAKTMSFIETRDARQLAATLEAFVANGDPGNTSFAEIALPICVESLAWQDSKEPGSPAAGELGGALEWFISMARVRHARKPGLDRDTDYEFVKLLLDALRGRDEDLSCEAAVLRWIGGFDKNTPLPVRPSSNPDDRPGQPAIHLREITSKLTKDERRFVNALVPRWAKFEFNDDEAEHAGAAASPPELPESLEAAEAEGGEANDPTAAEEKYDRLKAKYDQDIKVSVQIWDPEEGTSDVDVLLSEAEFREVLITVRRMRDGGYEHLPIPDRAKVQEATATLLNLATLGGRVERMVAKGTKPTVESPEEVTHGEA